MAYCVVCDEVVRPGDDCYEIRKGLMGEYGGTDAEYLSVAETQKYIHSECMAERIDAI